MEQSLTELERQELIDQINKMNQTQMASAYRFSRSGHPFFDSTTGLFEIFMARFKELGGMTPTISKSIGW